MTTRMHWFVRGICAIIIGGVTLFVTGFIVVSLGAAPGLTPFTVLLGLPAAWA